jgi:CO/xanthine dehydrogenase Mo-binding subunit
MAKKRRPAKSATGTRVTRTGNYRILVERAADEGASDLAKYHLDYWCMPQPRAAASGARWLHAHASGATVQALRKVKREVKVLADARKEGKRLQKSISKINRFAGGGSGPPGVGKLV